MNLEEFNRQPREIRDALLAWLDEHELRHVTEFEVRRGKIRAHVWSVNEEGVRYVVHKDGTPHVRGDGCDWNSCEAANEWVTVPLRSPCPAAA